MIKSIDPDGTRFPDKKYPWFQCATWDTCYRKLLDTKDPIKYMAVFRPEALYEIKIRGACSKVSMLDMSGDSSSFSGGKSAPHGWYLSTSISELEFLKLNQELLKIKLNGDLDRIMDEVTGVENTCGVENLAISAPVLLIPLVIIMGPPLLLILLLLLETQFLTKKLYDTAKNTNEDHSNIMDRQDEEKTQAI